MVPYGGFWWRFLAYIIDYILMQVVSTGLSLSFGFGISMQSYMAEAEDPFAFLPSVLTMVGLSIIAQWLYYALMESSKFQGTVGKLAIGLVVTDLDGRRISFGRATGRFFAKILSGVILCIGYIMVGVTARKQGLHDMLAGTLVYRTRDPQEVVVVADVFA
ncbi:RDD family protein [Novosphingobium sp. 1949]|uniref:RDD family protein n=1 Tax=Novosphingobium organovorum TaxID=2930092 RepID=A0ABT0BDZ9_9SPHN|nr:RDD family protein [Novosphingobium organovorum]MCJ2183283.1 RDD family protein [Novosphingobium organovorum]